MAAANLTAFVRGLVRTNVTEGTVRYSKAENPLCPTNRLLHQNAARGLTCVCPDNQAFEAISNSNDNLTDGPGSLLATVSRHGLTGSYYTTNFTDGDIIQSQNGYPILVTRRNGSIFLNDARLVGSNYIANSGSVHALDRVSRLYPTLRGIHPYKRDVEQTDVEIDFHVDNGLPQYHNQPNDTGQCLDL